MSDRQITSSRPKRSTAKKRVNPRILLTQRISVEYTIPDVSPDTIPWEKDEASESRRASGRGCKEHPETATTMYTLAVFADVEKTKNTKDQRNAAVRAEILQWVPRKKAKMVE